MPLITINQVQKYYGDNHVLKGVDLDIDMGQVISIIGRSGSGKSTLLRCINGLEGYQDGSIKLGGMTITDRRYIGHEDDTGYHHYAIDVAHHYELEE